MASNQVVSPGEVASFTRPPLAYPGNKAEIASEIIAHIPEHETYVEPFGGTAGVLFNKRPSRNEVINDADEDVTTFLRMLRDRPNELVEFIRHTPYSEAEYNRQLKRWKQGIRPQDPVRHAGVFFFLRRASFGSDLTGFRKYVKGRKNSARQFTNARDRLLELSDRLDGVVIRCTDWKVVIKEYASPDSFFYLDPPYESSMDYYRPDFDIVEFTKYWMRHFDGTPNEHYHTDEFDIAPPEFTEGCGEDLDPKRCYGGDRDPLTVMITFSEPISGLEPYTWTIPINDYTHEINNRTSEPSEGGERLITNYDPTDESFDPFVGCAPDQDDTARHNNSQAAITQYN